MKPIIGLSATVVFLGVAGAVACDNTTTPPVGTGGAMASGGVPGSGGAASGGAASGGAASGGAAPGSGGAASGGAPASGGTEGCGMGGEFPVMEHNVCADIPVEPGAVEGFSITSPAFNFCGTIPAANTCDGNEFGTGVSPELSWTGAPVGTLSYALVFKDIAILADGDPATEKFGYHWVMWDIPAAEDGLPAELGDGHEIAVGSGMARQWGGRNNYRWFPPCPNPFPEGHANFTCSLVTDSYSFALYALDVAEIPIDEIPPPDMDDMDMVIANWVQAMGHYLEDSEHVLGTAEYRGRSSAWSSAFNPPAATMFPCTQADVDAGMTDMCLGAP